MTDSLTHYGVKGMRWGKRKAGSTSSSSSSESNSEDHTKARALKGKKVNELSNSDLQTLSRRLQLEKSYAELTRTPSKFDKGHAEVKKVLGVASTASSVYAFVNSPLGKSLKTGIQSSVSVGKAAANSRAAGSAVKTGTSLALRG